MQWQRRAFYRVSGAAVSTTSSIAAKIGALFFVVIDFSLLYIPLLGSLEIICM
jgi:hypothetical protein